MKNFLFITNKDYEHDSLTGAHKRFLELVKSASKKNNVILISKKIPNLANRNIKRISLNTDLMPFLPAHLRRIITLSTILIKEKKNIDYDYAISFGPEDTISYIIAGYKNIITLFREDYVGYREINGISTIKKNYFKLLERITVKNSKKILVQCVDDKKTLINRYAKHYDIESKIFIQINNVNASWITEKHIKKDKKISDISKIAFIGNFSDKRKGHHILLPAIKKLSEEGYNILLTVVGDGNDLKKYMEKYKECEKIVFLGRSNNVNKLLAKSDFGIVPSLMDSCPNTVLESIYIGTAVYGTNIGGIKDILQKKKYMFEPNIDSIYHFVKNIIDQKKYINDAIEQRNIKERLTFDWGEKILKIITEEK